MKATAAALACGLLFGTGLAWSGMIDPQRVTGFLDVAGAWDPTLLFVMGGALAVTVPLFPLVLRRARPLLAATFHLPAQTAIDGKLLTGSALFGIGWGLAGFCPGPALAALSTASVDVVQFVLAMIAGQWIAAMAARRA